MLSGRVGVENFLGGGYSLLEIRQREFHLGRMGKHIRLTLVEQRYPFFDGEGTVVLLLYIRGQRRSGNPIRR